MPIFVGRLLMSDTATTFSILFCRALHQRLFSSSHETGDCSRVLRFLIGSLLWHQCDTRHILGSAQQSCYIHQTAAFKPLLK